MLMKQMFLEREPGGSFFCGEDMILFYYSAHNARRFSISLTNSLLF
jgi:hypothetical protein